MLTRGIIDIGIVQTPFNSEIFESICLPNDPMVAVTNGDILGDESTKSISIANLIDKPLIVDCRFETMIVTSCKKIGFKPRIICECDDVRSILLWAGTGMGVGIIPKPAMELNSNLKCKEIDELSLETRITIL